MRRNLLTWYILLQYCILSRFGGLSSQTVSRIALPSSQSATPCSTMLHPTFQSLQIGNLRHSPLATETRTWDKPTVSSSNLLTSNWLSSQLPKAFNFESNKLPLPGSYSNGKPNIFSQSVRREYKSSDPEQLASPVSSSLGTHAGNDKVKNEQKKKKKKILFCLDYRHISLLKQ